METAAKKLLFLGCLVLLLLMLPHSAKGSRRKPKSFFKLTNNGLSPATRLALANPRLVRSKVRCVTAPNDAVEHLCDAFGKRLRQVAPWVSEYPMCIRFYSKENCDEARAVIRYLHDNYNSEYVKIMMMAHNFHG